MVLRSPKHFKVGKHILYRYNIFFKVLFKLDVTTLLLANIIVNTNKTNFNVCRSLLPYTGTYTTLVQKYRLRFKYKVFF